MMERRRGWAWAVAALLAAGGAEPARADAAGAKLLAEADAAMRAARTLTAELTETMRVAGAPEMRTVWGVRLKKPNRVRLTLKTTSDRGMPIRAIVSDGKARWESVEGGRYTQRPAAPGGRGLLRGHDAAQAFFGLRDLLAELPALPPRHAGRERVGGVPFEVLELAGDSRTEPALRDPGAPRRVIRLRLRIYVGPGKRVTRIVSEMGDDKDARQVRQESALTNARWDAPLADAVFAYAPPAGAKPYEGPPQP